MSSLGARVLAVVAHPDDEAWAMGGTLARCASEGAQVRVLCMTRGEAGAAVDRSAELAASCALLGASHVLLDLPDGALGTFPVDQGLAAVRAQVDAFAPDAVLTLGPDGAYGHLDHIALTGWVDRCGARVLHAVFPPGLLHPVWRGLRRARFPGVRPGMDPTDFGSAWWDLEIDVSAHLDARRAAIAAHASQLRGRSPDDFLRPGLLAALGPIERWTEAP